MCRKDIHLAAVDMHVAPALTQHLKEQPQLRAAVRSMVAASTSGGSAVIQVPSAVGMFWVGGGLMFALAGLLLLYTCCTEASQQRFSIFVFEEGAFMS
jgi:hypothetical protein